MKLPELHADFLTKPLAHRGLHGGEIPENSRAAMKAAIDAGYGIELDLQLSADNEAMVFHDYDMKRLTGTAGPIRMQTVSALNALNLSNGEPIPTLIEILELVDGRAPLLIEIKDQDGALGPNVGILESRTAELLAKYNGPVAVMSFNPHSVFAMQKHAPSVSRGLVTAQFNASDWPLVPDNRRTELSAIPDFEQCGASFISHYFKHLEMPRVAELKQKAVPVLCWTIKSQQDETIARQVANNITFERYLP